MAFHKYDVMKNYDIIDSKFCLRKQILMNYISFERLYQNKANDTFSNFICGIVAEI